MNTDVALNYKAKLIQVEDKIEEIERIGFNIKPFREELENIIIDTNSKVKTSKNKKFEGFIIIDYSNAMTRLEKLDNSLDSFEIYIKVKNYAEYLDKNYIKEATTDKDGKAIFENLKKGKVKVYSLTPTGVKYLERTYCENELFGELEIFADKPILNYVEALEPCEAIKISKESFLEWIKYDSDFSLYVHIKLSEKMYHTSINSKANIAYSLKYRLLFFLWKFLDEHNLDTVHKDILVEGVGSNIRSVNRIIKELVDENFVEYLEEYDCIFPDIDYNIYY